MTQRRIALVTGANRGIGHEIARQLVTSGLDVVAASRRIEQGEQAALAVGARAVALDVTQSRDIEAIARSLSAGFDVLVNNAGVSLKGFDAAVVEQTLATNFYGAMHLTDRLLPLLRPGGRIVMVSSGMGELSAVAADLQTQFADPRLTRDQLIGLTNRFLDAVGKGIHAQQGWPTSAYRVSKIAMNAYTRILARELTGDPRHIVVNAVCPGWVRTAMGGSGAPRTVEQGAETPVWLALLPEGAASGGFYRDKKSIPF